MSRIICCGLEYLGYEKVWVLLRAAGVNDFSPGFCIHEWHTHFFNEKSKNDETSVLRELYIDQYLKGIEDNGNLLSGWCDVKSIDLCEYLLDVDLNANVVLPIISPIQFVYNYIAENKAIENVSAALEDLLHYYEKAVFLYSKYRDRCLLFDSSDVVSNSSDFIQECNRHFNITLNSAVKYPDGLVNKNDALLFLISEEIIEKQDRREQIMEMYQQIQTMAVMYSKPSLDVNVSECLLMYLKTSSLNEEVQSLEIQNAHLKNNNEIMGGRIESLQQELACLYLDSKHKSISDRLHSYQPAQKYTMKDDVIQFAGWYPPEEDVVGNYRWSGPDSDSYLTIDVSRKAKMLVAIEFVSEQLVEEQFDSGVQVFVDGALYNFDVVKTDASNYITLLIPEDIKASSNKIQIKISLLGEVKDKKISCNEKEVRKVGVCVRSVYVLPRAVNLGARYNSMPYKNIKIMAYMLRKSLGINKFPLSYFDGVGYSMSNKNIFDEVVNGNYSSALHYYLDRGLPSGEAFPIALNRVPTLGDKLDLLSLRYQV